VQIREHNIKNSFYKSIGTLAHRKLAYGSFSTPGTRAPNQPLSNLFFNISTYRSRVLGWRVAWMRNESGPACRLKSPSGGVLSVYDSVSRNVHELFNLG
jgi:hypothetical protein